MNDFLLRVLIIIDKITFVALLFFFLLLYNHERVCLAVGVVLVRRRFACIVTLAPACSLCYLQSFKVHKKTFD